MSTSRTRRVTTKGPAKPAAAPGRKPGTASAAKAPVKLPAETLAKPRPVAKAKPAVKPKPRTAAAAAAVPAARRRPRQPSGAAANWRVRVRMYRHGLGDCFLLSFRADEGLRQVLIDCGALARDRTQMTTLAEQIRDHAIEAGGRPGAPARLDVVVATHEHKDHVSGFNQARAVFDAMDIGSVWMGWTENLAVPEIQAIRDTRRNARNTLMAALERHAGAAAMDEVGPLMDFGADDDSPGDRTVAQAMAYLKARGKRAGDLRFIEPGGAPIALPGVPGVRVYALGPPRDPQLLKTSAVTERMKHDGVVYHLAATGEAGLQALAAAGAAQDNDRHQPFAREQRLLRGNPYMAEIMGDTLAAYDRPDLAWRRVDDDWMSAFGQLALDLDNDTNNTSLVLAFELVAGGEVLLFAADAQVGSWLSWAELAFTVPGRAQPLPAHDLLRRAVFYKVGHHCSHNATLKAGGLELMTRDDLTAFVPLDQETARKQGSKGWQMPAPALAAGLLRQTGGRMVISDRSLPLPAAAALAGVVATEDYIDYFLR